MKNEYLTLWEIMDSLYARGEIHAYESLKHYINNIPNPELDKAQNKAINTKTI